MRAATLCFPFAVFALLAPTPAHADDNLTPKIVTEPPANQADGKIKFVADPVGDGATLGVALAFGGILELIASTGEIRPQQPSPTSNLIAIDRFAITQTIDPNAAGRSTVGLFAGVGFAVIDPLLSSWRDGASAGLVDAVLYAESISITLGVTDLTKIAIRRPRPEAYIEQQQLYAQYGRQNAPDITTTNSALSFFSGHAAIVATVGGTATYLAFGRSPNTARPWLTLAGFTLLTSFVAYERVRAGAHFPTDVIAGSLAGAGIGTLVAHTHREDVPTQRPVWIGFSPRDGGGVMAASGSW